MYLFNATFMAAIVAGSVGWVEPLADMDGTWRGSS